MRGAIAIVAMLTLSGAARPIDAYRDVRRELIAKYPDWMSGNESRDFAKTLNRVWSIVGEWTAAYLSAHPGATAKDLAAAVEELNGSECAKEGGPCGIYRLTAEAIRLGDGTFVVTAGYPQSGTFFVVGKSGVLWNIKAVAARHYARRDEIAYWAWIGFGWGDGPMISLRLGSLPPTRGGNPRFYVDGEGAAAAGGTYRKQIGIWAWDGRAARPQFIRSYSVSVETHPLELTDGVFRIPIKGDFKTFFSSGGSPEPEVIWTLQVTPDGVHDLGKKHVVPELQRVDELFDRILRGRSTKDLASPRVVATLRKLFDGAEAGSRMGMLGTWSVKANILEFQADGLDCTPLLFTVEKRAKGHYFSDVRTNCPRKTSKRVAPSVDSMPRGERSWRTLPSASRNARATSSPPPASPARMRCRTSLRAAPPSSARSSPTATPR